MGLRPELIGQGLGRAVVGAAVADALDRAPGARLRCVVQSWNARGLRAAVSGGLVPVGRHATPAQRSAVGYVVLELHPRP